MQKTAYELWLKDQKKAMHLKCACFLEENAHKCKRCLSGDFIPYHHFTVDIRLNSLDMDTIRKMAKSQGFKGTVRITPFLMRPNQSWATRGLSPTGSGSGPQGCLDPQGRATLREEWERVMKG